MLSDQHAGWGVKIGFFFGALSALYWIPTYFLYPEVSLAITSSYHTVLKSILD